MTRFLKLKAIIEEEEKKRKAEEELVLRIKEAQKKKFQEFEEPVRELLKGLFRILYPNRESYVSADLILPGGKIKPEGNINSFALWQLRKTISDDITYFVVAIEIGLYQAGDDFWFYIFTNKPDLPSFRYYEGEIDVHIETLGEHLERFVSEKVVVDALRSL